MRLSLHVHDNSTFETVFKAKWGHYLPKAVINSASGENGKRDLIYLYSLLPRPIFVGEEKDGPVCTVGSCEHCIYAGPFFHLYKMACERGYLLP